MNLKTKVITVIVYTAVVGASAYYLAPQKVKIVEKEVRVEVEKKDTKKDVKKHTDVVTVVIKTPDGTSTITTHKITDTGAVTEVKDNKASTDTVEKSKEVTKSSGTTNISVLAGVDITKPGGILYGVSVNRSILGPISIGLWGISNGTCGASVGLNF